jgi:hypothetical protein
MFNGHAESTLFTLARASRIPAPCIAASMPTRCYMSGRCQEIRTPLRVTGAAYATLCTAGSGPSRTRSTFPGGQIFAVRSAPLPCNDRDLGHDTISGRVGSRGIFVPSQGGQTLADRSDPLLDNGRDLGHDSIAGWAIFAVRSAPLPWNACNGRDLGHDSIAGRVGPRGILVPSQRGQTLADRSDPLGDNGRDLGHGSIAGWAIFAVRSAPLPWNGRDLGHGSISDRAGSRGILVPSQGGQTLADRSDPFRDNGRDLRHGSIGGWAPVAHVGTLFL